MSETLRTLIRQADLSQGQVAESLGVDPAYVSNWVHGNRLNALLRHRVALSLLLGVSVETLVQVTGADKKARK